MQMNGQPVDTYVKVASNAQGQKRSDKHSAIPAADCQSATETVRRAYAMFQ